MDTSAAAASPPELPDRDAASPPHWLKRTLKAVANWFYANAIVGSFGLWLVGQVFRDRYHVTGLCLFIPSVLVAVGLAVVAALAWLCRCRRAALVAALLAIAPAVVVLGVENRWWRAAAGNPEGKTLRVVHWNIWGGRRGRDKINKLLKDHKADIYVLSEAYSDRYVKSLLNELGPDYRTGRAHDMVVIARGPVWRGSRDQRVPGRAYLFFCAVDDVDLSILVGDLPSGPTIYRAPYLRAIRDLVDRTKPDLVVGDLNTPRRSRVLADLPHGYAHAYHLAGRGWSCTWPAKLPLWAIDHCIAGPRTQAVRYDLLTTGLSDHRMQIFDFIVRHEDRPDAEGSTAR